MEAFTNLQIVLPQSVLSLKQTANLFEFSTRIAQRLHDYLHKYRSLKLERMQWLLIKMDPRFVRAMSCVNLEAKARLERYSTFIEGSYLPTTRLKLKILACGWLDV